MRHGVDGLSEAGEVVSGERRGARAAEALQTCLRLDFSLRATGSHFLEEGSEGPRQEGMSC